MGRWIDQYDTFLTASAFAIAHASITNLYPNEEARMKFSEGLGECVAAIHLGVYTCNPADAMGSPKDWDVGMAYKSISDNEPVRVVAAPIYFAVKVLDEAVTRPKYSDEGRRHIREAVNKMLDLYERYTIIGDRKAILELVDYGYADFRGYASETGIL